MAATAAAESADSSRDRILDAAERLVAARGYTAASISRIAKESGLPGSSIYWHFGSKEGLIAAMVRRGSDRWLAGLADWASYDGDLAAFLRGTATAMTAQARFVRVLFMVMLDGGDELAGARATLGDLREDATRRLARVIGRYFKLADAGADRRLARRLARYTLATLDGIYVGAEIDPDAMPIAEMADDLAVALHAVVAADRDSRPDN